uniref:Uncharacterized protein n=1 Tax=Acrobeloides nanus TaxID=290746 RepID=A0A914DKE7_9BILA
MEYELGELTPSPESDKTEGLSDSSQGRKFKKKTFPPHSKRGKFSHRGHTPKKSASAIHKRQAMGPLMPEPPGRKIKKTFSPRKDVRYRPQHRNRAEIQPPKRKMVDPMYEDSDNIRAQDTDFRFDLEALASTSTAPPVFWSPPKRISPMKKDFYQRQQEYSYQPPLPLPTSPVANKEEVTRVTTEDLTKELLGLSFPGFDPSILNSLQFWNRLINKIPTITKIPGVAGSIMDIVKEPPTIFGKGPIVEHIIPHEFYIPVPSNVHGANTINGRKRIARWALDRAYQSVDLPLYLSFEAKQMVGVCWYLAWCFGFVAYKGRKIEPIIRKENSDSILGLESLDWDARVKILEVEIPDINEPSVDYELDLTFGEQCIAEKVLRILTVAHIWTFEMGPPITSIASHRGIESIKKEIKELGLEAICNMETEEGRKFLVNLVGCVSPIGMFKWLLKSKKKRYGEDLKEIYDILVTAKKRVELIKLEDMDLSNVMEMPLFGAGAIRHEKAFNVLQTIAESPLQCSFPLWDKIDAFLDEYQRMTKNPLRYGHLAERLCGKELEIPRKMLHLFWPDICAFVNLYMMNGNSKLFERKFRERETPKWVEVLEKYAFAKKSPNFSSELFIRQIPANLKWEQAMLERVKFILKRTQTVDGSTRQATNYDDSLFS